MDYVKLLHETFESTTQNMKDAKSVEDLASIFKESMDFYSHKLIPSFFTTSEGEGRKIKDMYQQLREKVYSPVVTESQVSCIDLNIAGTAYADYLSGMCQFIEEACDTFIDAERYATESAVCEYKMNTAKQHDGEFIESIFGGCNNKKQTGTVLESVGNIEYLIDFMETIKQESIQCNEMLKKIQEATADHPSDLLMETARMMTESINNYVYSTVNTVFDSYNTIHSVLEAGNKRPTPSKPRRTVF